MEQFFRIHSSIEVNNVVLKAPKIDSYGTKYISKKYF